MGLFDSIWDAATDLYHEFTGIPTADEKRNQQRAINDQIQAYKEQTELTRKELDQKRSEEAAEKRRIEEKQIRALRRNYRSAGSGLLGMGESANEDMSSTLGG